MNLKFKFLSLFAIIPSVILLSNSNYSTSAAHKCSQDVNLTSESNKLNAIIEAYNLYADAKQNVINDFYFKNSRLEKEISSLQNELEKNRTDLEKLNKVLEKKNMELEDLKHNIAKNDNDYVKQQQIIKYLKLKIKGQQRQMDVQEEKYRKCFCLKYGYNR